MSKVCAQCGGAAFASLDTFKHVWWQCRGCGTATREAKSNTPVDGPWLRVGLSLARLVAKRPAARAERLLRAGVATPPGRDELDWYYFSRPYEQSPWKSSDDELLSRLRQLGVSLQGRRVLSVSDGPGFLARRLSGEVATIIITETELAAVEAMRDRLGIEARQVDLASESLLRAGQGPFDCVLLRGSCIGFARDFGALTRDLASLVAPGGVVHAEWQSPSREECWRAMFDDFAPVGRFPRSVVVATFERAGFQCEGAGDFEVAGAPWHSGALGVVERYFSAKAVLSGSAFAATDPTRGHFALFRRLG